MRRSIHFLLFFCALFAFSFLGALREPYAAQKTATTQDISVQDAAELLRAKPADLIILDVRTPGEFQEGHIPGAKNIDFFGSRFEADTGALPKEATILLYCRSGKRSAAAAESLTEAGRTKLLNLLHGLEGWKEAGGPLEK